MRTVINKGFRFFAIFIYFIVFCVNLSFLLSISVCSQIIIHYVTYYTILLRRTNGVLNSIRFLEACLGLQEGVARFPSLPYLHYYLIG